MKDNENNYIKPPSFLQMVKTFAKEITQFVKTGAEVVDVSTYTTRLGECNRCEYLKRDSMRCLACGCLLQAKARMKSAHCPEGKWENGKIGI